jgi:hypothetical protein
MSWAAALEGVVERLQTIIGLEAVITGYPRTVQSSPLAYAALLRSEPLRTGDVKARRYTARIGVLVRWQDFAAAETELAPFASSVPDAFYPKTRDAAGHPYGTLGGRVNIAILGAGEGDFTTVAETTYSSITWELVITDKGED